MPSDPQHPDRLPETEEIDRLSTLELVEMLQREDARVAPAVAAEAQALAAAVDGVTRRLREGGRLVYVGAGTSGRIAQLDAAELPPTFGTPPELVQVIVAGGEAALLGAVEGAEDDQAQGEAEAARRVSAADAVVGLAASGTTPFTLGALCRAAHLGAFTVAVTSRRDSPLAAAADVAIVPATGPEAIMGSTRLKAGTAQKMVLNTLSTAVMVRLGRVYSNLMVEMPATNAKLGRRAVTMVELAGGVTAEEAEELLVAGGGVVKRAVVMARLGVDAQRAASLLAESGGSLRQVLEEGSRSQSARERS